jgi:hypothetical protein
VNIRIYENSREGPVLFEAPPDRVLTVLKKMVAFLPFPFSDIVTLEGSCRQFLNNNQSSLETVQIAIGHLAALDPIGIPITATRFMPAFTH